MSALPNIIKWASQTLIYKSQVCHTCQNVTICINCDNPFPESKRCGCTVGKVISVQLVIWYQYMAVHWQLNESHHVHTFKAVPLDSYINCDLWSAVLQLQVIIYIGLNYISISSLNRHDFPMKILLSQNVCFDFLYNIFIIRNVERELIKNIHKSSCQRAVFIVRFTLNLNFPDMFEKYSSTKFHEILSMGTDGQTDMTKLTVAFRNLTRLTRIHFLSIFIQTQKLSRTHVGNFVETRLLTVAINQADSKQRDKILTICFESCINETEWNREKQVV
jgi:hypothetical protein